MRTPIRLLLTLLAAAAASAQTSATFTNAGLTLHYTLAGHGSPVVLLSGGPGMDAAYLQPIADIVAQHHTAILLDQRGTTGSMPSSLDATTITPELYLSDLEALRLALGYKQWTLLGHSAGSITAMRYAIAHPAQTQALILVGVVPPKSTGLSRMMDNLSVRLTPEASGKLGSIDADKTLSPDAKMSAELQVLFPFEFFSREAAAKFTPTMTPATCHALTSTLLESATPTFDYTADLAKLHIPTLILQGRQDPIDPEMASEARDAIPGSQLEIIERAGHFSWLDNPTGFTVRLNTFLATQPQ